MSDPTASTPSAELAARHRKELKDLQSRITQKKKNATKKTRKSVNDECAALEADTKARHDAEIAALNGPRDVTFSEDNPTDATLIDELVKASISGAEHQSDSHEMSQAEQSTSQNRKPNRQKARLARRAAEQEAVAAQAADEAQALPDLKARELEQMQILFKQHHLKEYPVAANGHCMYLAVADQIKQLDHPIDATQTHRDLPDFKIARAATAEYISQHPDDFLPFLEESLEDYIHKIKDTAEWGGQLELLALAKTYGININVIQADGRIEKIEGSTEDTPSQAWLAYYRHSFGLGEHYNSLRKAG